MHTRPRITHTHTQGQDRTHTFTHARTHSHTLSPSLPVSRSHIQAPHASQSLSFACPPAPATQPVGHTHRPPCGGHTLRPGTFAASHLARPSHILSHPHSLSSSDSFSFQPTHPQPTLSLGRHGWPLRPSPARAPGGQPLAVRDQGPTAFSISDSQPSLSGADRQTDRQTHSHMLTPAPPHGSSLFLIMGQCACLLTQLEMVRE